MNNYLLDYLNERYKKFEFKKIENEIYQIDEKYEEGVQELISKWDYYKDWIGKYLITYNESFVCIDNSSGDCWCEEFNDYNKATDWLNNEFEVY